MTRGSWASGTLLALLLTGGAGLLPAAADGTPAPANTPVGTMSITADQIQGTSAAALPPGIAGPTPFLDSLLLACDSCGCSVLPYDEKTTERGWQFGIGEQFTYFGRVQTEGQLVANPGNEWETSFITQFLVGYNFNNRNGITVTIPYIDRSFHRIVGPYANGSFVSQDGNVSGLGDVTLQDRYVIARHSGTDYSAVASISAGLKLPTGSPDELREQVGALLGGPDSLTGGHDIALGSGSLDELIGAQFSYHRKAFIADAIVQYALRNPGAFGYRYGNEFQWDAAAGFYLRSTGSTGQFVAAQLVLDGENKNEDVFGGNQAVVDTGATEIYLGPRLSASLGHGQFATLELDLPVKEQNSDTQLVPSYKARASFVVRL